MFKINRCILKGYCNRKDSQWDVPFPFPSPKHTVNKMSYIIQKDLNKIELAQYLHACMPVLFLCQFQPSNVPLKMATSSVGQLSRVLILKNFQILLFQLSKVIQIRKEKMFNLPNFLPKFLSTTSHNLNKQTSNQMRKKIFSNKNS